MACDTWHMSYVIWHVTCDMWHLTCDTWHVTCYTWYMTFFLLLCFLSVSVCFVIGATIRTRWEIHCLPYAWFFDPEDAIGSVPHSLIKETLRRNHLPSNILFYFSSKVILSVLWFSSWHLILFFFTCSFKKKPLSTSFKMHIKCFKRSGFCFWIMLWRAS